MKASMKILLPLMLALALIAAGCNGGEATVTEADESDVQEETVKNELKIALNGQPSTLDPQVTTAALTKYMARNIYESLFTQNENFEAVPMLAESVDQSDDGKTYTFHLREGVKFHNGEEMTAEDVVASMERWHESSTIAKQAIGNGTFSAEDDYTAVLELEEPSVGVLNAIATSKQAAAIMPKDIAESANPEGAEEYIGTGPYKFEEWVQDQYIHLTKFEDYQAVDTEASGLAGKKVAEIEDLYFYIVPDPSTRLTGIQTGEYDIANSIPFDSYEQIKDDANVEVHLGWEAYPILVFNKEQGPFTDAKLRQAVNAALNIDEIMLGAFSNEDLYDIHPGYMHRNQTDWFTDAGAEAYNQSDPEKAKQLLEEAGYDGEEIRIMASRDYEHYYNVAVIVQQQLENIGMNVKLENYDWPTFLDLEHQPDRWEMEVTGYTTWVVPPENILFNSGAGAPGWTDDERVRESMQQIMRAPSQEEAKDRYAELQDYLWNEYVPGIKMGHFANIYVTTDKVEGFSTHEGPIVWNTKVFE